MTEILVKARNFMLTNARLLERRLFQVHFEGESSDCVGQIVRAYQNSDGGLGHALEPDVRCPESQPIFGGIGLAAPQIGSPIQIIVADIGEGAVKIINPRVIKSKGEDRLTEGCLSLPDISVDIKRFCEIWVEALNEKGERIEVKAKGLLARVIQHEIDHLKGRLIIDYLSLIDKMKLFKSKRKKKGK